MGEDYDTHSEAARLQNSVGRRVDSDSEPNQVCVRLRSSAKKEEKRRERSVKVLFRALEDISREIRKPVVYHAKTRFYKRLGNRERKTA